MHTRLTGTSGDKVAFLRRGHKHVRWTKSTTIEGGHVRRVAGKHNSVPLFLIELETTNILADNIAAEFCFDELIDGAEQRGRRIDPRSGPRASSIALLIPPSLPTLITRRVAVHSNEITIVR